MEQKNSYDTEHLYLFLLEAKSRQFFRLEQQYGVDGNLKTWTQEQQIYEKGDFCLKEKLRMEEPFCGQDIVFYQKRPIWMMNYFGNAPEEQHEAGIGMVLELLRMSLYAVCKVGGMNGWIYRKKDGCLYLVRNYGGSSMYNGKGYVYRENREVYRYTYYGGIVSD